MLKISTRSCVKAKTNKRPLLLVVFGLIIWFLWAHFFPTRIPDKSAQRGNAIEVKSPSRLDKLMEIGNYLGSGNVDIKFYGTVVDEDSNPLSGVEVRYSAEKASINPKSTRGTVQTDADGNFDIDTSGMTFEVNGLVKKGYLQPRLSAIYGYQGTPSVHKPDKNRREQFVMLKEDIVHKITEKEIRINLNWDRVPVLIDLATGRASTAGELRVTATRDRPEGSPTYEKFPWRYNLELVNGGFRAPPSTATHGVAPKEGYLPQYIIDDSVVKGHGVTEVYFQHNGLFGRFLVYVNPTGKVGERGLRLMMYTNTSGGRLTEK
jgi:hypothetical protein